ncbi:hypothetical protein VDF76_13815 [Xanthomonas campestris pv. raphani]|uniref:hypothetical protein n=1 Tax=Xanthomonas campestris TaxID=339 RepID=UPI002B22FDCC|nr:hypothetical protein [Xanthomonas campestris]MEA9748065.1 hypothetical protein [Xanthomonas campestris pv. raphani]MEA9850080.1 hypothetical protein [Xanthomonas campestris pv. raphani]MEA9931311.1 hypothetical protein [Xanthomonas campestris pv. raphani]
MTRAPQAISAWFAKSIYCLPILLPANPASLALHRQLGFQPIGEAVLESGKRVQYLEKAL